MKSIIVALLLTCHTLFAQTIKGVEVGDPTLVIEDQYGNLIILSGGQCLLYGKPYPGSIATIILTDSTALRGCAGKIDGVPVIVTEHKGGFGVIPIDITQFKKSTQS